VIALETILHIPFRIRASRQAVFRHNRIRRIAALSIHPPRKREEHQQNHSERKFDSYKRSRSQWEGESICKLGFDGDTSIVT
jgi:hypothetical protein